MVLDIALLLLLLVFSFAFSGSEVALFSLSSPDIPLIPRESTRRRIGKLLKRPYLLLTTILSGNTAVNSFAASLFTALIAQWTLAQDLSTGVKTILDIALFTLILLIFGEITPKMVALSNPRIFAERVSWFIYVMTRILSPLTLPLSKVLSRSLKGISNAQSRSFFEIEEAIRRAKTYREKAEEDLKILAEAIWFVKACAIDISVPRDEIKALSIRDTLQKARKLFLETRHRRYPVYHGDLDHVVGILDLSLCERKGIADPSSPLSEILLPPLFVPATLRLSELFFKLKESPSKMAIVVDEYGGTRGLVTFWDIASSFVGKIRGEYETEDVMGMKRIGEDVFLVPGDTDITDLEDILKHSLGERGTLSGFLVHKFGYVPREGESLELGPYVFEVLSTRGEKIERVRIARKK